MGDGLRELTKVEVVVGGEAFSLDAGAEAVIDNDLEGLNSNLASYPGLMARWLFIERKVTELVDKLENALEVLDAQLYTGSPAEIGGKKATVEAIKAYILLNPQRKELNEQLLKAKADQGLVSAGCRVMYAKKESLLALASNTRAEMDNRLYVSKRKHEGRPQQDSGWRP